MNKSTNFESKIREKLENNRVDYQESYWNAYDQAYPLHWYHKIRFTWKSHAIFAYSLFAFALGFILNGFINPKAEKNSNIAGTVRDTVVVVNHKTDTVFMFMPNPESLPQLTNNLYRENLPPYYSVEPIQPQLFNQIGSSRSSNSQEDKASQNVGNIHDSDLNSLISQTNSPSNPIKANLIKRNDARLSQNLSSINSVDGNDSVVNHFISDTLPILNNPSKLSGTDTQEMDSLDLEDSDLNKINKNTNNWEWALGINTSSFLSYEINEFSYNYGVFGGLDARLKRHRYTLNAGLLYGAGILEIEEIENVNPNTLQKFEGYSFLNSPPEDVRVITQAALPHIEFSYSAISKQQYTLDFTAGLLGCLPFEREFIYDYSWQNQIRTREAYPNLEALRIIPNMGISLSYFPRYNWQFQLGGNWFPTMMKSEINEAFSISPFSIQFGLYKYW